MDVRIPFLKTRLPELAAIPEPRRQEILARCIEHPTMQMLAKRQMVLWRVGYAILVLGVIAYPVLSRTGVNARITIVVQIGAMLMAVVCMVGSVLLYWRRSSKQLRLLVQTALRTAG